MAHTNGDRIKQKEDCGCCVMEINAPGFPVYIDYCPKHKAAPDFYEACKMAKRFLDDPVSDKLLGVSHKPLLNYINQALAKVESH